MKLGSRKAVFGAAATTAIYLGAVALVGSRATPAPRPAPPAQAAAQAQPAALPLVGTAQQPVLAEQIFKNVQVLRGIPATEFMHTMGFFSASTLETCTYCHSEESDGSWEAYAQDTNPLKDTARQMIRMVNDINRINFAGAQVVTCFSCHQGAELPKSIPSLAEQYAPPEDFEPDMIAAQNPNAPTPDQVIDKYIQAIGGASRVAGITSIVARGAYEGYSVILRGTVNFYAKAPNQQTIIFHTASGESTVAVNGREGWQAGPEDTTPFPVIALSGPELEGLLIDARLTFPAQIKQALTRWRTGAPFTIDDREVQVVQGNMPSGYPVKLYFDSETGLLVREVRYIKTAVGLNPYQIDFGNYKEVSGVKLPSHMVITWTDGFSKMDFDIIEVNVPIPAAVFNQPARPRSLQVSQR